VALTIVSYNIHSGVGTDGRFDLHRVGEVLQEIDADIVALQECGDFLGRTGHDEHPEHLAASLGMELAFGPNVIREGRRFGNAILSKLPILKVHNYDLSQRGKQQRGALRCDLKTPDGKALHIFCLHLGLGLGERRAQEAQLLSSDIFADAARDTPLVLCGDFNYWWSGQVPALVRHSIVDAALGLKRTQRTYPSRFPLLRLDRMFIDRGICPLAIRVHKSALAQRSSDHLPVVMRFETLPRLKNVLSSGALLAS
jgi:endonuclease/exonuclease/phosphatase family metal-dependent hydrolase